MFSFALSHYFALGVLALASYILGRRLLLKIDHPSFLEELSFSLALGLGVLAYSIFGLGVAGLLYPPLVLLTALVGVLICYRVWAGRLTQLRMHWARLTSPSGMRSAVVSTALVGTLSIPLLILPLYPPTAFDSTMYHLASSKLFVENHQVVSTPYLRYPVLPQTNHMLFTLALLLRDDVLAQLVEFLMMAALVAALIAFGRRFYSARTGWWAAALLVQSPLVLQMGSTAYTEMGLMLFVTLAIYAFWIWAETREQRWLLFAGIFCGLAVGAKLSALFFMAMLQVAAFFIGEREGRIKRAALFGLAATLVALPWFSWSFYHTGNPLFPLFSGLFGELFGYRVWDQQDYQEFLNHFPHYGVGKGVVSLLLLPWNLTINWRAFGGGRITPIVFFAPHLLFVFGFARARIGGLLALGVSYTLFWFFGAQESRFLLPALPILCVASAAAADQLALKVPLLRRQAVSNVVTIIGVFALAAPGAAWAVLRIRERGPVPVTEQQRDDYLSRRLPSYQAYKFLNELGPPGYKVFAVYDPNMAYFADGVFVGDYFGPGRYSRVLPNLGDGQSLYDELSSLGIDFLLVRSDRLETALPADPAFQERFKSVYTERDVLIFELRK